MSRTGRLRLDEVISSVPELGPTLPDGGYSWIIFLGATAIYMTVPSIVCMYGVVLGHLAMDSHEPLDLWQQKIALTPILFTAFLNLTDPWTAIVINLASAPRIMSVIGVCLLSIGLLASGYLATGGVGAYLASLSAGAVMGVGGSFILVQTDSVLRRNFRTHLRIVLTLSHIATSVGFILMPGFVFELLNATELQTGLLVLACSFIPTVLGSLVLRYPLLRSRESPYTLLVSDDDNETTRQTLPAGDTQNADASRASGNASNNGQDDPPCLLGEGSNVYSYQDNGEDQELFSVEQHRINVAPGWRSKIRLVKSMRFWVIALALLGTKSSALFTWILLPSLAVSSVSPRNLAQGIILSVVAGFGTLIPHAMSYWRPSTARWRSLNFGGASWLGCAVLLGLTAQFNFDIFIVLAFLGGVSMAGTSVALQSALLDSLGSQTVKKTRAIFSTVVGLSILAFSFISSPQVSLRVTAAIQFLGGCYWIFVPISGIIQAR